MPNTGRRTARVLILSPHPLLAALLGMLLELESFEPTYAEPGESPEDALARIKPLLVILLDGEMDAAQSDLFFARAGRRGVRVVLFKPPASQVDVQALAATRSLDWISLPVDRAALARVLGDGSAKTRSLRDRRSGPVPALADDGALIYHDRSGRQWFIYDRRGGLRRAADRTESTSGPGADYRAFVNELGEEFRVPLPASGALEITAEELERQLARATRFIPRTQ